VRGVLLGFLITLGMWLFLALAHMAMELAGGRSPLAAFTRDAGGRYIAVTVAVVLALGTGIGIASERVRRSGGPAREERKEGSASPG